MQSLVKILSVASLAALASAADSKACGCADAENVIQCLQTTFGGFTKSQDLTFIGTDGKSTTGQGSAMFKCDDKGCELAIATTHRSTVDGEELRAETVRCFIDELEVMCLAQFSNPPPGLTVRRRRSLRKRRQQVDIRDMVPGDGETFGTCSCEDGKELKCDFESGAFRGINLDKVDEECTKDKLLMDAITVLGSAAQCQGLYEVRDRAPSGSDDYVSPYYLIENQLQDMIADHLGL